MKTFFLTLILVMVWHIDAFPQVGIGTVSPASSSILDVTSTTKGLLIPRMTQAQRLAIATPAAGLMVYQTDIHPGYYFYDGSAWNFLKIRGEGGSDNLIDADGNVYTTVVIGDQEWMAEDLRVLHYRNGEAIPKVTGNAAWGALTSGAYCWYGNDSVTYLGYAVIYNWYAVNDSRNLCPDGWHVATNSEWATLITYLGGATTAGGPLKNSLQWQSPNTGATNSSCFSARPGGWRTVGGTYLEVGQTNCFWTSTLSGTNPYYKKLIYNGAGVTESTGTKVPGYHVRCIKD